MNYTHSNLQKSNFISPRNSAKVILIVSLILVFQYLLITELIAKQPETHKNFVLIIKSQEPEYTWTSSLLNSFVFSLINKLPQVETETIYIDFNSLLSINNNPEDEKTIRDKFINKHPKLIVAIDDRSFRFLIDRTDKYFPDIPILFSGISDIDYTAAAVKRSITGIVDKISLEPLIETAIVLHPEIKNVLVLFDESNLGKQQYRLIDSLLPHLSNVVNFRVFKKFSVSDIEALKKAASNSLILLFGLMTDAEGQFLSPQKTALTLSRKLNVPIYSCWSSTLNYGVVGCLQVKSFTQGIVLADMAAKILNGENAFKIPVIENGNFRYLFDYNQLKKFNINASELPLNRLVINKPTSFYNEYIEYVWIISIAFLILSVTIVFLFLNIKTRSKAEKELIKAKEEAEKSDRLKTEFLAQVSHEIRTPVNTILSFSALIKDDLIDKVNDDLVSSFQIIESGGRRLVRTIDLILNMSQLQTGNFELNPKKIDLQKEILNIVYVEFAATAKERNLEFIFKNENVTELVLCDLYTVTQIFTNLIDNAIKYTPKGKIELILDKNDQNEIYVEVKDTGIGISKDFQKNLFSPFAQEESGYSRRFEGNGLGLALVKKYAVLNNAEIIVDSTKGQGSSFKVVFKK
ncbi:MAG: sensor histidine kinase [Ignavibacteriales bacterium]|nr:sensor histidine kinase [Ignavibacteriales bacterium]